MVVVVVVVVWCTLPPKPNQITTGNLTEADRKPPLTTHQPITVQYLLQPTNHNGRIVHHLPGDVVYVCTGLYVHVKWSILHTTPTANHNP